MKMLLWKDGRQNGPILAAVLFMLTIPYAVVGLIGMIDVVMTGHPRDDWRLLLHMVSIMCVVLTEIVVAFVAGNAFAGERADRSDEFIATVPIPRGQAVVSRAIVAAGTCVALVCVNLLIVYVTVPPSALKSSHRIPEGLVLSLPLGALAFGAAWLASALMRSPIIATITGMGAAVVYAGGVLLPPLATGMPAWFTWSLHLGLCPVLAVGCFALGMVYGLRPVEAGAGRGALLQVRGNLPQPGTRMLLWKDYHQQRRLLLGAGGLLAAPYVIAVVLCVGDLVSNGRMDADWIMLIVGASVMSFFLSEMVMAFVAGHAIAGERGDRSAEFVVYLPIQRAAGIASKAVVAGGPCLLLWGVNFAVAYIAIGQKPRMGSMLDVLVLTVPAALLIFGASWLCSSVMRSPSTATIYGLGLATVYLGAMALLYQVTDIPRPAVETLHFVLSPLLGLGCFVAGVLHLRRRVEA